MKRIGLVFGTRPEAIKLLPLAKLLRERGVPISLVFTAQHRELAECVFRDMNIYPDIRLSHRTSPTFPDRYIGILSALSDYAAAAKPSAITVCGDTATAHAAATAAYLNEIPVYHVEAGLRTYDNRSPYPEEFFRRSIAATAELHFAPNSVARDNLLSEGIESEKIFITGNTVTDAIKMLAPPVNAAQVCAQVCVHECVAQVCAENKIIFTMHRRENEPHYEKILSGLFDFAMKHPELKIVYPAHPRCEVSRAISRTALAAAENIRIQKPLSPREFYRELTTSRFVITDSGGIEEECAALGVPALVIRNKTERVYELMRGDVELVGTAPAEIFARAESLLLTPKETKARTKDFPSPSQIIADIIEKSIAMKL